MRLVHPAFKSLFLMTNLVVAPAALAAGDMLTPDEVQHHGVSSNPTNDSGMFLGAGVSVGQGRSSESGSTPGLALFGHVEPGYQFERGSWGRLEVSADVFAGTSAFRTADDNLGKVTTTVPFGVLIKGGYGYSLGEHAFGLFEVGVGPAAAKFKIARPDFSAESDTITGLAYMVGYKAILPINRVMDGTIGVSWTQMQFDLSKLSKNGTQYAIDRTILNNVPAIDAGLRFRF